MSLSSLPYTGAKVKVQFSARLCWVIRLGVREFSGKLLVFFIILPGMLAALLFTTESPEVARSLMTLYYAVAVVGILGLAAKG